MEGSRSIGGGEGDISWWGREKRGRVPSLVVDGKLFIIPIITDRHSLYHSNCFSLMIYLLNDIY